MTGMKRLRPRTLWAVRLVTVAAAVPLAYVAWDQATYNFGTVQPGRIYRSGQMPAEASGKQYELITSILF